MNQPQPLRVGILTFLHNDNYGSTLQAYALQRILREMGADAVHLDYTPSLREKVCNMIRSGNSPKLLLDSFRRHAVKQGQRGAQDKSAAFQAFYRAHMHLTPPCATEKALGLQAKTCDCLVAGSDQIWSPTWLNRAYFLSFAPAGVRKVAYAPSLGVNRITNHAKARRIFSWLSTFDALSVRESQGAAILQQLIRVRPPVMPDPVTLLSGDQWRSFAAPVEAEKPYLLCYFIGEASRYWAQVERLAAEKGISPLVIPVTDAAYAAPYAQLAGLSPQSWVGAIQGAAYVITDSFHCTLFAAMLGRPFTAVLRDDPNHPASRNSRLDQLFQRFGIIPGVTPDWADVEARHEEMARQGKAFLRQAVFGESA